MKKNLWVVGLALAACALLLAAGLVINRSPLLPGQVAPLAELFSGAPAASVSPEPQSATATDGLLEPQTTAPTSTAADAPLHTAPAGGEATEPLYLVVTVGKTVYQPIALDGEREFTVAQAETGASNTVHISPQGVYMAAASCHNQDCVKQGQVTQENRDMRPLGNLIVCLPNQVTLQLCTAEEADGFLTLNER